jgi:hypothetical protein
MNVFFTSTQPSMKAGTGSRSALSWPARHLLRRLQKKNEVGFTTRAVLDAVCKVASNAAVRVEVGTTKNLLPLIS